MQAVNLLAGGINSSWALQVQRFANAPKVPANNATNSKSTKQDKLRYNSV